MQKISSRELPAAHTDLKLAAACESPRAASLGSGGRRVPAVDTRSLEPPSSRYSVFERSGGFFRIEYSPAAVAPGPQAFTAGAGVRSTLTLLIRFLSTSTTVSR